MKVLITGGAGYIGSHTASAFLKQGYSVTVFDNLSTGFREAIPKGCNFLFGDIRDSEHLKYIIGKESADGVIHFAAKLQVSESVSFPLDYYDHNVAGVISLVKACNASNVKKIVFSSTAAVYSGEENTPVTENSVVKPLTPYGQSKLISEKILLDCEKPYGIRAIILRYFNVAGASDLNGPRTQNASHLIKVCAEAACGKRPFVEIFGTDYPTPDGSGVRDYLHVEDLAQMHVLGFSYLGKGLPGKVLNCGYGSGFSVFEVISMMRKVSGKNFESKISPRRPGDLASLTANANQAQSLLGWKPSFNNLETICRSAFEWEKKLS